MSLPGDVIPGYAVLLRLPDGNIRFAWRTDINDGRPEYKAHDGTTLSLIGDAIWRYSREQVPPSSFFIGDACKHFTARYSSGHDQYNKSNDLSSHVQPCDWSGWSKVAANMQRMWGSAASSTIATALLNLHQRVELLEKGRK